VARTGVTGYAKCVLVRKPMGRRLLGRSRCRLVDNIVTDIQETGWGVDCIVLNQERNRGRALLNTAMYLRVLQYARNFLTS
jgi:hypothetical protein